MGSVLNLFRLREKNEKRMNISLAVSGSRDGSVGIATVYGLDDRSSILGRGKRFTFSSQRPDRLRGPPSLLSNEYRGLFLQA
jgi:hypothetical protein